MAGFSGTKAKRVNDVINLRIPKIEAEPQSHVSRKMNSESFFKSRRI